MTLDVTRFAAWVRHAGAIAAMVIAALGTGGLPTSLRDVLFGAGGLVPIVEHAVAGIRSSSSTSSSTAPGPSV